MAGFILEIYDTLQEIAWHFGAHGINGECCGDLSFVEYMALKKTGNTTEISVQEIGSALNFTKSGATRIVDRLEGRGYVVRQHSPTDGRVCCITLTETGKQMLDEIEKKYTAYLENVLIGEDPQKIGQLKEMLESLLKAIQKTEKQD